jgi:UDP-N-acetylmuramoyl-L-alanyl-D-glutamate--2,6-diaminopimelate ligase
LSAALAELLDGLDARVTGDAKVRIESVTYDSRRVQPGALFVALPGLRSDGHQHVAAAVEAGAVALLVERDPGPVRAAVARVADTRSALPRVSARFFGAPARDLTLVGVTGTNGKTSTVRMLESIFTSAGKPAGSLGTVSARYAGREEPSALTTPESVELQGVLRRMRDAGTRWVAMEVSSHSLATERVGTLRFAAAGFTNLTHDHLDFHGDMAAYADAKALLFDPRYLQGSAALPAGDAFADRLAESARAGGNRVLRYARSAGGPAEVRSLDEQVTLDGSRFVLETPRGRAQLVLPLAGDFQLDNALLAAAVGEGLELPFDAIVAGLAGCPPVPGRLERVAPVRPAVFVDYAHTPDALDRILSRLRPLVSGRLICVFGCGGDRDRSKRAPMARAACQHSDRVIATSDNPRSEDPAAILAEVAQGLSGASAVVIDRRQAIVAAIAEAAEDDAVVIAGKGHEDYQIVGSQRLHFDDREEARKALASRREAARP